MRHVSKCFNKSLTNIQLQANKLVELQKIVLKYLPDEMQANCKVGCFNDGCLVLTVNDAVWASQLRFLLPELRNSLRSNEKIYQLANIKINIERSQIDKLNSQSSRPISLWQSVLKMLYR